MKKNLTKRQNQVFNFLNRYLLEKGYPPTFREIGSQHGISSTNGVNCILKALEKKGYIKRSSKISRGIEITGEALKTTRPSENIQRLTIGSVTPAFPREVPILGHIAAGKPILAEENLSGTIFIDPSFLSRHSTIFALIVKGDSMVDAGILPGDTIIVEQQTFANSGDIVVALINDEATVKKFYKEKNRIRLESANARYTPISVTELSGEFQIAGKVIGSIRKYC